MPPRRRHDRRRETTSDGNREDLVVRGDVGGVFVRSDRADENAQVVDESLIREVELFRTADTRTNAAVSAREGAGDCRHVAIASQALFDAVQQDKTNEYLKQAAGALARNDQDMALRIGSPEFQRR